VHGPVVPVVLAVLAGAVERIDDPDPVGAQPARVVDRFLAEDHVIGAVGGERGHDRLLRRGVPGVPEGAAGQLALGAQAQQDVGRRTGGPPSHADVVDRILAQRHRGS
jgi:hypothetical protein